MHKPWKVFLQKLIQAYSKDNISSLAAALAYYMIFSLAPILIICIALTGFFVESAEARILDVAGGLVDPDAVLQIKTMVQQASKPFRSEFAHIMGMGLLMVGALGIFHEIQTGLNTIWGAKPDAERSWFYMIMQRLLSFAMVLVIAFLLLIFFILSVTLTTINTWLTENYGLWASVTLWLNDVLSFLITIVLFALMFKILPDIPLRWRQVWLGAAITALLFFAGKYLLGLYLQYTQVASLYGAAGSLIILLIWVYYSAQIFFIGAEITKLLALKPAGGSLEKT